MTDVTFSGLPAAGALTGAEIIPLDQSGATSQTTLTSVSEFMIPAKANVTQYTISVQGFSVAVTTEFSYVILNSVVFVKLSAITNPNSNSGTLTVGPIPTVLSNPPYQCPSIMMGVGVGLVDNTGNKDGWMQYNPATGYFYFYRTDGSAFTASGQKGLLYDIAFSYLVI